MAFWTIPLAVDQATGGEASSGLLDTFGGLFGGNDDPALPEPLSITSVQLGRIYDRLPNLAQETRSYILSIGFCPDSPDGLNKATCSEIQRSTERLAAQAIYLANGAPAHSQRGIGEGFGPEERHVRSLVEQAIRMDPGEESSVWNPSFEWLSDGSQGGASSTGVPMSSSALPSILMLVVIVLLGVFVWQQVTG